MSDGKGCVCCAYCSGECVCGADWTPQEVIDAHAVIRQLAKLLIRFRDQLLVQSSERPTIAEVNELLNEVGYVETGSKQQQRGHRKPQARPPVDAG